jgi:hypothetical protein
MVGAAGEYNGGTRATLGEEKDSLDEPVAEVEPDALLGGNKELGARCALPLTLNPYPFPRLESARYIRLANSLAHLCRGVARLSVVSV